MSVTSSRLRTLSGLGLRWDPTDGALECDTPHAFTKATGYLKYALRSAGPVFARGQTSLHPKMLPSLFRGSQADQGVRRRAATLAAEVNRIGTETSAFITGTPKKCHAPLLQHYGWKTPWLDLVDNAWVALWFGAYECETHRDFQRYSPRADGASAFAYVVMLQVPEAAPTDTPGLWNCGTDYQLIDLRRAAPSLYVRPHAQHGVLVSRRTSMSLADADLQSLVVGAVKVTVANALAWLGRGGLASVDHLFPPPHHDRGYDQLLLASFKARPMVGTVVHVTP